MINDLLIRKTDFYVKDDYEAVMFRYDADMDRYFRRFINESFEKEVPRENKLLFDTLRTGQEITREQYLNLDGA